VINLEIRRLIINVPPGTTKSLTCSVIWPAWSWIENPGLKWMTASYSGRISRRDALRARHLLESKWYKERWGTQWHPDPDNWSSIEYRNLQGGFRFATTVGGGATGEHAHHQLIDDPIKPLDVRGASIDPAAISIANDWWTETMASRVVDPATATRTIIMQRLHERDLSGTCLDTGDYVHLNLPQVAERQCYIAIPHSCSLTTDAKNNETPPTPIGYKDHREEGDLLWPERFSMEVVEERKREFGSRGWAAQDQQRPVPAGGGVFKRDWIQHWTNFPKGFGCTYIQSWDCAFKGLSDSDYVVGQVWVRRGSDFFLVDQVRDQMSFSATVAAVKTLSSKWPRAIRKLIEDKANGPAVINHLEDKIPGLQPVNPQGGKAARANAIEPLWECGNVWLPNPDLPQYHWVHDFIEELLSFTGEPGRPDDQVDAMTQALVHLSSSSAEVYHKAMQNIR
jgi:predicted phage terminase large subunit-like protein